MSVHLVNPYGCASNSSQPEEPLEYRWLAGNLHAHSTRSDGEREPQAVIDTYAGLGHGFMGLSDHDVCADFSGLLDRGMILLPCNEVSAGGPHLLHLSATRRIFPISDRQKVLDEIAADGGLGVLCHPNLEVLFDHYPFELMLELKGYIGIEIYNAGGLELCG